MATLNAKGGGTKESPWELKTPPGSSEYTMYKEDDILVCKVGSPGTNLKKYAYLN